MKDTKVVFDIFRLYNLVRIAEKFEAMAKQGWQVESMNAFFVKYRKMPPRDIKYSLIYVDKSSDSELISKPSEDFVNLCEEMGWQHIITYSGNWYVFMNTRPHRCPIETDPVVQVENINRYLKGQTVLGLGIAFVYAVIPLFKSLRVFRIHPYYYFYHEYHRLFLLYVVIISMFLINARQNILWYRKAKKMVREQNRFANINIKNIKLFITPVLLFMLLYTAYNSIGIELVAVFLLATAALAFITWRLTGRWYKKDGRVKQVGVVTKVLSCTAGFAVCISVFWYTAYNCDLTQAGSNLVQVIKDESLPSHRWYVYNDEIPLKVEDLTAVPEIVYSYEAKTYTDNSFLTIFEGKQLPHLNNQTAPRLHYEIIKTDNKKLFDMLYNDRLTQGGNKNRYTLQVDRSRWQADKVVYNTYTNDNSYIITKGNTIIAIKLPCEPTQENIKTIMRALADY